MDRSALVDALPNYEPLFFLFSEELRKRPQRAANSISIVARQLDDLMIKGHCNEGKSFGRIASNFEMQQRKFVWRRKRNYFSQARDHREPERCEPFIQEGGKALVGLREG